MHNLTTSLGPIDPRLVLFFACAGLEPLAQELSRAFPHAVVAGCSTAGEIGNQGFLTDQVSALGLGAPARVAAEVILDLSDFRFDTGPALIAGLASQIGRTPKELTQHPESFLFIMLADGLSGAEEVLLASIGLAAPGVHLVGGSAGDNFRFQETLVASGGRCHTGAAVLVLLEPGVPFEAFAGHHYQRTERTVVVTSADPENRLVHRIDGRPALAVAADLLGVETSTLEADPSLAFATAPLVFGFRGKSSSIYNRSVMSVQGTSLLMGGAVESGTVLTVMRQGDMVEHARRGLDSILSRLPNASGQLLFDCGGRLLDARAAGRLEELGRAYNRIPTVGFTTYGEFFGSVLVNHTLTGVVFGVPE
jgi:hypothetical protein